MQKSKKETVMKRLEQALHKSKHVNFTLNQFIFDVYLHILAIESNIQ